MKIANYALLACILVMTILFSLFHGMNNTEGFVEGNRSRNRLRNRPKDRVKRNVKARSEKNINFKYGDKVPAVIPEVDDITAEAPTDALRRLTDNAISNQQNLDNLYNN